MMKRIKYIPNQAINDLFFLEEVAPYIRPSGVKERRAIFLCKCGVRFKATIDKVKNHHTQSCGCYQKQRVSKSNTKHSLSYRPLYYVWAGMKQRCYDTGMESFHCYGGKGVKICDEWLDNIKSFIKWAENNGYRRGLTLDRQDNNGNYEPSNCRWVTQAVNNQNRSTTKLTMGKANEIRKIKLLTPRTTMSELGRIYNVSRTTIKNVLSNRTWAL